MVLPDDFDPIANLAKIRAFTDRDDAVPGHYITHITNKTLTVDCTQGTCKAIQIAYHPDIGVIKATLAAETTIRRHIHKELELIFVLEGRMLQEIGENLTSASPGEILIALPNLPHKHYCIFPTVVLGITIPASAAYPSVVDNPHSKSLEVLEGRRSQ